MNRLILCGIISFSLLLGACKEEKDQIEEPQSKAFSYTNSIQEYWKSIEEGRKNGYLQLVGLMKLDKQEMNFGHSEDNYLNIAIDSLPKVIATFTKEEHKMYIEPHENVKIKAEESYLMGRIPLKLDSLGNSIQFTFDRLKWQVITRNEQPYLRVWDSQNADIAKFKGFKHYPLNGDFLFEADFSYYDSTKSKQVKSQLGPMAKTDFIGEVSFTHNEKIYKLEVGDNGFLMVADATTGESTYGGGRYMYLDLPETDGKLVLDFNRLYNPPCSFNKFTTCLYPPQQNELPFEVKAGEKIELVK